MSMAPAGSRIRACDLAADGEYLPGLHLLSTIWALGDFNAVRFVSGGGPALSTHVLATLGIRNAFELGDPKLGMAAVMSALPLLIPLVILLMRQLRRNEVQL